MQWEMRTGCLVCAAIQKTILHSEGLPEDRPVFEGVLPWEGCPVPSLAEKIRSDRKGALKLPINS